MIHAVKFLAVSAFLVIASADFPLNIDEPITRNDVDETIYRIPEDLDPIHYDVEITPYFEATADREAFTFDGTVTLSVRVSIVFSAFSIILIFLIISV